jgi:hypothetical protein
VTDILAEAAPETLRTVRTAAAERVLNKSLDRSGNLVSSKFAKEFAKSAPQLGPLFKHDPKGLEALSELAKIASDMNPQTMTGAMKGAQSAGIGRWMAKIAGASPERRGSGPISWVVDTVGWLQQAGAKRQQQILAELIGNPESRKAFARIAREARKKPNASQIITGFLGKLGRSRATETVFDFRDADPGINLDVPPETKSVNPPREMVNQPPVAGKQRRRRMRVPRRTPQPKTQLQGLLEDGRR